jgi:hypothetical protein
MNGFHWAVNRGNLTITELLIRRGPLEAITARGDAGRVDPATARKQVVQDLHDRTPREFRDDRDCATWRASPDTSTPIAALAKEGHPPHGQGRPPAAVSDERHGLMRVAATGVFHREAQVRHMNITRTETVNELPCGPTQAGSP